MLQLFKEKNKMRPKYSNEGMHQDINIKSFIRKHKSPLPKKQKHKNDKDLLSFLGIQKSKLTKKKQQMQKNEQKLDSNNTTANCTYSRSKIIKSSAIKPIDKQSSQLKRNQKQISGHQIMIIINTFAIKIQKQWRVYIFRKKFNILIHSIRQNKIKNEIFKNESLKFIQKQLDKGPTYQKKVPYVLYEDNGEIISSYDLYKYQQHQVNMNNSKENSSLQPISHRSNSSINHSTSLKHHNSTQISKKQKILKKIASQKTYHENHQFNKSSTQKLAKTNKQINQKAIKSAKPNSQQIRIEVEDKGVQQNETKLYEERRSSFDIYQQQSINVGFNRRHSTGQIKMLNNPKKQSKPLQIDKVLQIEVKTEKKLQKVQETKKYQSQKQTNSKLNRLQNEKNSYNIKFPLQKILKKQKKDIQISKLKKLLSIENRYNKNEMTYRSYLQIVKKINDDHQNKIKQFKEREGLIISNWIQLVDIVKPNKSGIFLEDEIGSNSVIARLPDACNVSISFEKWDFNSSAKKSIDQQLDLSQNLGQTGKLISFQSVLRQLQEQQKKQQAEQKIFKKIKSSTVVQAIAERSKQASQKDISQFSGLLQHNQNNIKSAFRQPQSKQKSEQNINSNQNMKRSQQINNKRSQQLLITPKISHSIEFQSEKGLLNKDPPSQIKHHSQSLIVSQIEAVQYNQHIFSDKSSCLSDQKIPMNELIFKDFKVDTLRKQISQTAQQRYQRILQQFIDLANEKSVLSNIKIINSVKFLLARAIQEKKIKKQNSKLVQALNHPKIQTNLNSINLWLLQISHFMLDNFQKIIRDNLIIIKQPPALQLLHLCKKNIPYTNVYQTIPQYVFKEFQFFFIKNAASKNLIQPKDFDSFSTLFYTFHRCLIDCLNLSLTQELITGRNWLQLPWRNDFKKKKRIEFEHAKTCLQRTINTVSNWGQYGLGRLSFEDEAAEFEYKYYEQQRLSLVCRQEVNQFSLCPIFTETNILLQISISIYQSELSLFLKQLKQLQYL